MYGKYRFLGGPDVCGRMFLYEKEMKEYDLSSSAIRDCVKAIKNGDLNALKNELGELSENQVKGLLNLYIDTADLGWGSSLTAPMGIPLMLAKTYEQAEIAEYIESRMNRIGTQDIGHW